MNFLIAEAVPKSLPCMPTSFLIFLEISFVYFLGRSYDFYISFSVKTSSAEVTFFVAEDRTHVIWISSVSTLVCDFFTKYARNFSLFIFYRPRPDNSQQDSQMYF